MENAYICALYRQALFQAFKMKLKDEPKRQMKEYVSQTKPAHYE